MKIALNFRCGMSKDYSGLQRQTQHDGNRNQSMNIPLQSLSGSYASKRCHLYFCSQPHSPAQRFVCTFLQCLKGERRKKKVFMKLENSRRKSQSFSCIFCDSQKVFFCLENFLFAGLEKLNQMGRFKMICIV